MLLKLKNFFIGFYFSFPIQLLVLHFKRNHLLMIIWLLIFTLTGAWITDSFGVHGLILFPEYLNVSGFSSFFIVGITVGGFVMGFNLYSYILHGSRFRFIATVHKPFLVFSYNNLIIPLAYLVFYSIESFNYQTSHELISTGDALMNILAFHMGFWTFIVLSFVYFVFTNKNILTLRKNKKKGAYDTALHRKESWVKMQKRVKSWKVSSYVYPLFSFRKARNVKHYRKEWIDEILEQNHINGSLFELVAIVSFFLVGALGNKSNFMIPSAASIFLFFTIVIMLISAFFSWMKGWTFTVLIGLLLLINAFSTDFDFLNVKSHAYGIDYKNRSCIYTSSYLESLHNITDANIDRKKTELLLDKRLDFNQTRNDSIMILVNVSGGGLRSTAWAFTTLMELDSLTNGALTRHTILIAGSSGGMIGAAYWRELMYRKKRGLDSLSFISHFKNLTNDLLNPIIFTMVGNDFSFRFRKTVYRGHKYKYDRAFAFEKQLNKNTNGWFDVPLSHYQKPEANGEIPMLIISPTILNDGRRLLISSQPISYLSDKTNLKIKGWKPLAENVEFRRLFINQNADSLRYLSALRMNATFPYILPAVTLPSNPEIEVMDAGIRDNYGLETSYQFAVSMRSWIKKNIRKIIVIQIRDKAKEFEPQAIDPSLLNRLQSPIGNIYGNFGHIQEYMQDELISNYNVTSGIEIEWITFSMQKYGDAPISLNFHLTGLEKRQILQALHREDNMENLIYFKRMFLSSE